MLFLYRAIAFKIYITRVKLFDKINIFFTFLATTQKSNNLAKGNLTKLRSNK